MKKRKLITAIMATTLVLAQTIPAMADTSTSGVEYYSDGINQDNLDSADKSTLVTSSRSSTFSVTIPKKITLPGQADENGKHITQYNLSVKGDIGGDMQIKVIPAATVTLSQEGKDPVDATVTQTFNTYKISATGAMTTDGTVKALPVASLEAGYTDENVGKIEASNLSAGAWSGTYSYTIVCEEIAATP